MSDQQYIWQPVARMNPNINIDDRITTAEQHAQPQTGQEDSDD